MSARLFYGDCRQVLRTLDADSVQCVITSPPYYGLRDYGLPPLVWGGIAEHEHEWASTHRLQRSGVNHDGGAGYREREDRRYTVASNLCPCGAWLGSLGLEPTPELFIAHMVEVFRQVWRVLRDDGTVWLNLGDSYAGSGKGPTGHNGIGDQIERQGFNPASHPRSTLQGGRATLHAQLGSPGYKAKDLMMLPARVALALQADGWYVRSMIPWLKRNSMPESVADRPATAVEYVFLLSKQPRYFWDADSVRQPHAEPARGNGHTESLTAHTRSGFVEGATWVPGVRQYNPAGRSRRNSDWFFESWQGLLLDEQDVPMALVINPQPFKDSHFATFPPKLVEPMIKASTRPGDTVLDPFGGSGTVGLVADRLERDAVLCELKPDYHAMGQVRVIADAPMFVQLEAF